MTLNPDSQLEAMSRLRAKNRFGISTETLEFSSTDSLAKLEAELLSYTKQLSSEEVLGFISKIPEFDLGVEFDPGSSTHEELEARCRELKYRVSWLEALLTITQEELKVFSGALEEVTKSAETE